MTEPREPDCPKNRKPHRERVKEIDALLPEGKVAAIMIDDTQEHREWYLHEIAKYPKLKVDFCGIFAAGIYMIRVRKEPQ